MKQSILVTGASGYIGSHTSLVLLEKGYEVYAFDSSINSSRKSLEKVEFIYSKRKQIKKNKLHYLNGDIRDHFALDKIFQLAIDNGSPIKSVIHFAGLKSVPESITNPIKYWDINVNGTINLIKVMEQNNCSTIVYSSSASVYGNSIKNKITEDSEIKPINPYGNTKATVEAILKDVFIKSPGLWKIANLRYFNPIGAHQSGIIGEDPKGMNNNLFPMICEIAFRKKGKLKIYGKDWSTCDGTTIRDYIHVMDVAEGHLKMLEKLIFESSQLLSLNLGRGCGTSILELLKVDQSFP